VEPMLQTRNQARQRHGAPVLFLDQRAFLETELELVFSSQVGGTLRAGTECAALCLQQALATPERPVLTWLSKAAVQHLVADFH
jgi:hypothetical protein